MADIERRRTVNTPISEVRVGSDVPGVVQSMTNTDTADIPGSILQIEALAQTGSKRDSQRSSSAVRLRFALFCCSLLALISASAQAPSVPAPAPTPRLSDSPLPKDPAAALDLLRKVNGLGEDTKPWHVHATYQTFDEQGKPAGTGTFEMWWASATKYKRTFDGDSFKQTEYGTPSGPLRTGVNQPVPYPQSAVLTRLVHPLPAYAATADLQIETRNVQDGPVSLGCFELSQKIPGVLHAAIGLFPTYCIDGKRPLLRLSIENVTTQTLFNKIVQFRDEYLAKQIDISEGKQPVMKIVIDDVGSLQPTEDSFFTPPPDAVIAALDRPDGTGVIAGNVLRKIAPIYPASAKQRRSQGTVILHAIITREGRVRELGVVSSPDPELSLAAIFAAQQWTYKPYMLNGAPTEVSTRITVHFTLGG